MKIGILLCDNVDEPLRERIGQYPGMFTNFFAAADGGHEYRYYDVVKNIYPDTPNECDAYAFTGSRHSCYEQIDWILKLREYIKLLHSQQIKMFGICFGHQIIADTLGGKTERFSGGWGLGIHTFNQIGQASWRKNHPGSVNIGLSCQDQVIKLPTDASLYLTSDFVKNAGYTIGNHVITVQGHPEMPPAYLTYLIEKRLQLKLIDPETGVRHMQSMLTPVHNVLLARWVLDFWSVK